MLISIYTTLKSNNNLFFSALLIVMLMWFIGNGIGHHDQIMKAGHWALSEDCTTASELATNSDRSDCEMEIADTVINYTAENKDEHKDLHKGRDVEENSKGEDNENQKDSKGNDSDGNDSKGDEDGDDEESEDENNESDEENR